MARKNNQDIWEATKENNLQRIKYLIENENININERNENGYTPLHYASDDGYLNIVKYLINKGANINIQANIGWTPLHIVCIKGHLSITEYLINKGADIHIQANDGRAPLHYASDNGHLNIIKYLIDKGADINIQNKRGETPLHIACNKGNLKIIEYLINKGADINIQNNYGKTPLEIARENNKTDCISFIENYLREKQEREEREREREREEERVKIAETQKPLIQELPIIFHEPDPKPSDSDQHCVSNHSFLSFKSNKSTEQDCLTGTIILFSFLLLYFVGKRFRIFGTISRSEAEDKIQKPLKQEIERLQKEKSEVESRNNSLDNQIQLLKTAKAIIYLFIIY